MKNDPHTDTSRGQMSKVRLEVVNPPLNNASRCNLRTVCVMHEHKTVNKQVHRLCNS